MLTASVSSLTRASYIAQFTPWTATTIATLDLPLNKLFRRLSENMPTFPTRLLYLPTSHGGLGLPRHPHMLICGNGLWLNRPSPMTRRPPKPLLVSLTARPVPVVAPAPPINQPSSGSPPPSTSLSGNTVGTRKRLRFKKEYTPMFWRAHSPSY